MADWTAKVIQPALTRVVDGDTYWMYNRGFYRQIHFVEIRLDGYDTPEIFHPQSKYEYEQGLRAKDVVIDWFRTYSVDDMWCSSKVDPEKFGRWLGRIYTETSDLGKHLFDQQLAVLSPDGKAKWRDTYVKP